MKESRPWQSKKAAMGEVVHEMIAEIRGASEGNTETRERLVRQFLELMWYMAMKDARTGDRKLMYRLLDTGEPVPASAAYELLTLKSPRGRPRKWQPEEVVEAVRWAIINGHPYRFEGEAEDNDALSEAARRLEIHREHVKRLYISVPQNRREEIKNDMEQSLRSLEQATGKSFIQSSPSTGT